MITASQLVEYRTSSDDYEFTESLKVGSPRGIRELPLVMVK